jgi:hypothetical protein
MSKRSSSDEPTYVDFVDDFLSVVKQSLNNDPLHSRVGNRVPSSSGSNVAFSVEAQRFAMGADDSTYLNAGVAMLAVASAVDEPPLTSPASYSAETLQSTKEALLKLAAVDRKAEMKRAPARVRSAASAFRPLVQNFQALSEELNKAGVLQTLEKMDKLTANPEVLASNAEELKKLFNKLDKLLDPRKGEKKVVDAIEGVKRQAAEEAEREANYWFQAQLKNLRDALEETQTQHLADIEKVRKESETLQNTLQLELQEVEQKYGADTNKLKAVLQKRRLQYKTNIFNARQRALALKKTLNVSDANIQKLQNKLEKNETKLGELKTKNSDLKNKNKALTQELAILKEAKRKLDAEIESLQLELDNADKFIDAAQVAERSAVEQFQSQIEVLTASLREAEEGYGKMAENEQRNNELNEQLNIIKGALEQETVNTTKIQEYVKQLQSEYEARIGTINKTNVELQRQLSTSNVVIKALQTEIQENEEKLDEVAKNNADLKGKNKSVNSQNVSLLNQGTFYKQENARLNARLSSVLAANERLQTENQLIQIKLRNAESAIERLRNFFDSTTEAAFDARQANGVVENATESFAELDGIIVGMQSDIDFRIQENNQLLADLAAQKEMTEKCDTLLVQFKEYSKELERLNRAGDVEYEELDEKYEALLLKAEGDNTLIAALQADLEEKKTQLLNSKADFEAKKEQAGELQRELFDMQIENGNLLSIMQVENNRLQEEIDRLKANVPADVVAVETPPAPPPPGSPPPQKTNVKDRIAQLNKGTLPAAAAASLRSHLSRVARAAESLPQTRSAPRSAKRTRLDPDDDEDDCPLLMEETLDAARSIDSRVSIEKGIEICATSGDVKRLLKRGLASMLLRNPLPATAADDGDDDGFGVGIGTQPGTFPPTPPDSPGDATTAVTPLPPPPVPPPLPPPPPPAPPTTYVQIQDGLARFVNDAFIQLALFEPIEEMESKLNDLFPSGSASERRGIVWNEMLRDAALAGDRLWAFVRTLSGLIGESADSIFSSLDETAIKAQEESKTRRDEIAKQVSEFQGKLLSELAGSLLKNSTLQFATSANESDKGGALVVVDAEAAKKIKDMAAGTSGMPFFEANVALRHLETSASGKPQSIDKIVSDIAGLGQALHDRLMEQLIPTLSDGVSLTELAHPRNSYCVRLKDDTTAAILEAYDRFSTEFALKGGSRVSLWELVEGADATLSQRFAAFVGHVLVQNRTSTGVNALYTSRAQLSVNSAQASVSLQRLVNQAAAYRSRINAPDWTNTDVAASRASYFAGATNATLGTWAHNSFRGVGPSAPLYRVGWIRGISY